MTKPVTTTKELNNGVSMPVIGLGTYQLSDTAVESAVESALSAGYRRIDTAKFYQNEREIGDAIKASGIPRKEIFITTKLWPTNFINAEWALEESLDKLQTDYVDLYLIHWPFVGKMRAWKALEACYADGRIRAIGVSNYSTKNVDDLLKSSQIMPAINQVEFSPFFYKKDLLNHCAAKGITLEAYSPLTRGKKLHDPIITAVAEQYGKSPSQIMIRWALEHGLTAVPKASSPEHIAENINVFDFSISPDDMAALDALNNNFRAGF